MQYPVIPKFCQVALWEFTLLAVALDSYQYPDKFSEEDKHVWQLILDNTAYTIPPSQKLALKLPDIYWHVPLHSYGSQTVILTPESVTECFFQVWAYVSMWAMASGHPLAARMRHTYGLELDMLDVIYGKVMEYDSRQRGIEGTSTVTRRDIEQYKTHVIQRWTPSYVQDRVPSVHTAIAVLYNVYLTYQFVVRNLVGPSETTGASKIGTTLLDYRYGYCIGHLRDIRDIASCYGRYTDDAEVVLPYVTLNGKDVTDATYIENGTSMGIWREIREHIQLARAPAINDLRRLFAAEIDELERMIDEGN